MLYDKETAHRESENPTVIPTEKSVASHAVADWGRGTSLGQQYSASDTWPRTCYFPLPSLHYVKAVFSRPSTPQQSLVSLLQKGSHSHVLKMNTSFINDLSWFMTVLKWQISSVPAIPLESLDYYLHSTRFRLEVKQINYSFLVIQTADIWAVLTDI